MRPGPLRRAQRPWPPYPIRPSLGRVMAPGTRLELSAPVPLMRFGNKGREQKRREQTRCLTGRSGAAWQAEDTVGLRSSQPPQAIKPFSASAFVSPLPMRQHRVSSHGNHLLLYSFLNSLTQTLLRRVHCDGCFIPQTLCFFPRGIQRKCFTGGFKRRVSVMF